MDAETAEEKRIARAVARQGRGVVRVSPRPAQPVAVKKVGGQQQQQQQREAVTKRAVVAQPVSTTTTTAVRKTGVRRHGCLSFSFLSFFCQRGEKRGLIFLDLEIKEKKSLHIIFNTSKKNKYLPPNRIILPIQSPKNQIKKRFFQLKKERVKNSLFI